MGLVAHHSGEPLEQIVNIPSTEGPMWNMVKIGQVILEKMFRDYTILYMYTAQAQGQLTPGGQNFDCN